MRLSGKSLKQTVAFAATVLAPSVCRADAGAPMILLVWPGFWILLFPIIAVEAAVARRIFKVPWRKAFHISADANLTSTLIGIPLTWLVMFALEMLVGTGLWFGSRSLGSGEPPAWAGYAMLPLSAAWVSGEEAWAVPAAAAWLSVFFFLASVWIERWILTRRHSLPAEEVRRWSWQANILSYSVIEVLLLAVLGWTLIVK